MIKHLTGIEITPQLYPLLTQLCLWLTILLPTTTNAQYYGYPKPIPASKESELLNSLKNTKASPEKVNISLELANLYYNIPLRQDAQLVSARIYAEQARQLSQQLNYRLGFEAAQVRLAEVLWDQHQISAAEALLPTVKGTAKISMLLTLSYKNFYEADDITDNFYRNALIYASQARDSSVKLHDKQKEIIARTILTYFRYYGNYPGTEKDFQDILKDCNRIKYPFVHYVYQPMFAIYMSNGNYEKGFELAQKSLELELREKDPLILADCYGAFSNFYRSTKQLQKSIDYLKLAIEEQKHHPSMFGDRIPKEVILTSKTLRQMGKNGNALSFMKANISKFPANEAEKARYEQELGLCYQKIDITQAERHLLKSYKYLYSTHQAFYADNFLMAQFYIDIRSYGKARLYLERITTGIKQKLPLETISLLEYFYFKLDSAGGDYRAAIAHLSRNKELDNSYLTEKKNHDIEELSIKYETKKKEDQIKILDQNSALERDNVQRLKLIKNVTIGGISFTIVIAGLLFRQSSQRKKNNREILKKNELLEKVLKEKEWLLKEVHHRVKNNLHTVVCLLESQALNLTDDALKAIENCQHRIYAMSLIHQKLYQSEDIKTVNMGSFLPEFIGYLKDSLTTSNQIHFEIAIDPIKLGVSFALPLSLIINEAVTNAIKYAFPGQAKGTISVSMRSNDLSVKLIIADNGVGINTNRMNLHSNSLGLKLIQGLSEDIQGNLKILNKKGTVITLEFLHEKK